MQNTQAEYHLLLFDCIFVYSAFVFPSSNSKIAFYAITSLMKVIMFMSVRQHF